jgi:transposase-like protein
MLKLQLPLFAPDLTFISKHISYQKREGRVYYFHGLFPLFFHGERDLESFRFITSQLVVSGNVKEIEIARAFGVSYISVKRGVKRLREEGGRGFFKEPNRRGAHVLTVDIIEKAQRLLYKEYTVAEVAKRLDLKADTVRKATRDGRLNKKKQKTMMG